MVRFTVRSCSSNNFLMLSYHVDTNVILVEPFEPHNNRHHLTVTDRIMNRLTKRGHGVDLQVLDKNVVQSTRSTSKRSGGRSSNSYPLISLL